MFQALETILLNSFTIEYNDGEYGVGVKESAQAF